MLKVGDVVKYVGDPEYKFRPSELDSEGTIIEEPDYNAYQPYKVNWYSDGSTWFYKLEELELCSRLPIIVTTSYDTF